VSRWGRTLNALARYTPRGTLPRVSPKARALSLRLAALLALLLGAAILLSVYRGPRLLVSKTELALRSGTLSVTVYGAVWNARKPGFDWTRPTQPWMTWRVLPRLRSRTLEVPLWPWFTLSACTLAFALGERRGRRLEAGARTWPAAVLITAGMLLLIPLPNTKAQLGEGALRAVFNGGFVAVGLDRSETLNTSNFASSSRLLLYPKVLDATDLKLPPGSWCAQVPLWHAPLLLLLLGSNRWGRARGSRVRGVLCPGCDYALDAVPIAEGRRTCPECGLVRAV